MIMMAGSEQERPFPPPVPPAGFEPATPTFESSRRFRGLGIGRKRPLTWRNVSHGLTSFRAIF